MAGEKTVELRRRFTSDVEKGTLLLIYETTPTRAIVGSARIAAVSRLNLPLLWQEFGGAACLSRQDFDTYFLGSR